MAITILKRGFKPLLFRTSKGKPSAEARQVNVAKWRRKDGRASFVQDLISLRKTLALCYYCARKRMPRQWQHLYVYEELKTFHGVDACDYCREEKPISLFLAGDEPVWQSYEKARRHEQQVRARERALLDTDRRYLLGV